MRTIYCLVLLFSLSYSLFAQDGDRKVALYSNKSVNEKIKPVVQEPMMYYVHEEKGVDTITQKRVSEPIAAPYGIDEHNENKK